MEQYLLMYISLEYSALVYKFCPSVDGARREYYPGPQVTRLLSN